MITFSDFSFTYKGQKRPTLKHLDFKIYDGEKVLLCGPSGCGKSTIGNCINGLIPNAFPGKSEGKVLVSGVEVFDADIHTISRKVGTVLQDTDGQFVGLTVAEDMAFALENMAHSQSDMFKEVESSALLVGMQDFLKQKPQELSGGQKQRVSLAGVLVEDTEVLLFDEPLANLDPATGLHAIELIDDIHKETGKTCIIIEHRLEDVLHCHVDRVILIEEGEIAFNGSVNELLQSGMLIKAGVREPLYLSALRKAGADFSSCDVSSLDSFDISSFKDDIVRWQDTNASRDKNVQEKKEILRFEDINFSYDGKRQILENVSFSIYEGDMVSLLGNNGAGKSTIASIITGINRPDSGNVYLEGKRVNEVSIFDRSSIVGYVMQNPNHMISQTLVYDEVAFGLRKKGVSEEIISSAVMDVLTLCGLEAKAKWPISALSYGQKKRVTIASILVMKPKLLILDEPTAGQDYYHYTRLMEFVRGLRSKLGLTMLFITHDMHLALEYTPRSLVLSSGSLIADDRTSVIFSSSDILKKAALAETSLFKAAKECGIEDIPAFIDSFIVAEDHKEEDSVHLDYTLVDNADAGREKKRKKKKGSGVNDKLRFGLSYIPIASPVHSLSGVTKFLFLFIWVFICFTTFDIRILASLCVLSWVIMKLSRIPLKVFKPFIIAMIFIIFNNALFIFLFAPGQGTEYLYTRTVLFGSGHYAITLETLWYLLVICFKYFTIFPVALLFVSTTDPSEFASSLNKIGLSYKISYSVALALRYLPDVINDYTHILHAQMCRGVDVSSNAKIKDRLKGIGAVMAPLIMSSFDKIDTVTNALVLRGFGRSRKRTWYSERKLRSVDFITIAVVILIFAFTLYMRFARGVMFYFPFQVG